MNIARQAVLAAGFDATVPAVTIDRQCGSSQQAAHFAAQGVMAGAYDIVIAAGVESMSRVPLGSSRVGGSLSRGHRGALPGRAREPGRVGGAHRAEVGVLPGGARRLLGRVAPSGGGSPRPRAASTRSSCPSPRSTASSTATRPSAPAPRPRDSRDCAPRSAPTSSRPASPTSSGTSPPAIPRR